MSKLCLRCGLYTDKEHDSLDCIEALNSDVARLTLSGDDLLAKLRDAGDRLTKLRDDVQAAIARINGCDCWHSYDVPPCVTCQLRRAVSSSYPMTNESTEICDEHGYPTDAALEYLRGLDIVQTREGLAFLEKAWNKTYGSVRHELTPIEREFIGACDDREYVRFTTGGWSGNEDLLSAYAQSLAHFVSWVLSSRGGDEIYALPQSTTP